MKTLVLSKFIFYYETFFLWNKWNTFLNPSFKGHFHSSIWNVLFFSTLLFFGKKKERIQKPLKMYMHFSFWLFDQMKICFCIFHYLRGGKKLTTSISFPSYYRLNVYVFSKFLCWNCNLQCDGVRSWAFGCPSSH